jgi:hypothetical protein
VNDAETSVGAITEARGPEAVETVEVVDLEEHAKAGKKPPRAQSYRIRIDREYREVEAPGLTGRQILGLVGKTPEGYLLSQKLHGGAADPIGAEQYVDFTTPGIERFQTLALDPTEG